MSKSRELCVMMWLCLPISQPELRLEHWGAVIPGFYGTVDNHPIHHSSRDLIWKHNAGFLPTTNDFSTSKDVDPLEDFLSWVMDKVVRMLFDRAQQYIKKHPIKNFRFYV